MKGIPRSLVESLWVSAGTYAQYAAMFGLSILINRTFGTAELGRFGIAWAAAQLTVQSAVAGFSALHRRDVAYRQRSVRDLVADTLGLRLSTLGVVLGGAWAVLYLAPVEEALRWAIGWTLVATAFQALGLALAETLQAEGRNRTYGLLSVGYAGALALVAGVVWASGAAAPWLYPLLAVAGLAFAVGAAFVYIRVHGIPRVRWASETVRATAAESWPLVVNALVVVLAARVTVLIVGGLEGEVAAGMYTFASGVVGGFAVVASAFGVVLFPRLCAQFIEAPHTLRRTMYTLSGGLAAAGASALATLVLVQKWVVALYGGLPEGSSTVLVVLALGLVASFVFVVPGYLFTAIQAQHQGMKFAILNAAVLATLVAVGAATWGLLGAAAAVASGQTLMAGVALMWVDRLLPREHGMKRLSTNARPAAAY
jgi:O-antigen/teichoic acid export membrane protein